MKTKEYIKTEKAKKEKERKKDKPFKIEYFIIKKLFCDCSEASLVSWLQGDCAKAI